MGTRTDAAKRQPHSATIHSGRFSLQMATAWPLTIPVASKRAANARARRGDFAVAIAPGAIAVVVGEEFAVGGCEIGKEIQERAPRHRT